jgi:hypothetical protein
VFDYVSISADEWSGISVGLPPALAKLPKVTKVDESRASQRRLFILFLPHAYKVFAGVNPDE